MIKPILEGTLIKILKGRIAKSNQRQVAKELDISPQYLNDIIKQRRFVSAKVAQGLGFKRIVIYKHDGNCDKPKKE